MRVRMKTSLVGAGIACTAGDILELPDADAKRYIASGDAVPWNTAPDRPGRETMALNSAHEKRTA